MVIGWVVKTVVQNRPFGLSLTGVRRLFQSIACFGSSLAFVLITLRECDMVYTSIILCILSLTNMCSGGGESMIPLDLSEKYPATIMAIANCLSCISAFTIPSLKKIILGGNVNSVSRWNSVMIVIAAINVVGGVIFWVMVRAEPIDIEDPEEDGSGEVPFKLTAVRSSGVTTNEALEISMRPREPLEMLQEETEEEKEEEDEINQEDEKDDNQGEDRGAEDQKEKVEKNDEGDESQPRSTTEVLQRSTENSDTTVKTDQVRRVSNEDKLQTDIIENQTSEKLGGSEVDTK